MNKKRERLTVCEHCLILVDEQGQQVQAPYVILIDRVARILTHVVELARLPAGAVMERGAQALMNNRSRLFT